MLTLQTYKTVKLRINPTRKQLFTLESKVVTSDSKTLSIKTYTRVELLDLKGVIIGELEFNSIDNTYEHDDITVGTYYGNKR